jgi:serine/threonine protein kinase
MGDQEQPPASQAPTLTSGRAREQYGTLTATEQPKELGDFEILREIGRGGMGVVYEARQVSLNRRVALKVLPPALGMSPQASRRFEREAHAAAKLHHTNIVPVYSIGEQAGSHYYAMELVEGQPLDRILKELVEQGRNPLIEETVSRTEEQGTPEPDRGERHTVSTSLSDTSAGGQ